MSKHKYWYTIVQTMAIRKMNNPVTSCSNISTVQWHVIKIHQREKVRREEKVIFVRIQESAKHSFRSKKGVRMICY